jgi:transcriptional regulator with XRE-family HTH domain
MSGNELRERREKLGLSQSTLAKKLGTTQNTVSRWELGTMEIQNPVMLDLALQTLERKNERKQFGTQ